MAAAFSSFLAFTVGGFVAVFLALVLTFLTLFLDAVALEVQFLKIGATSSSESLSTLRRLLGPFLGETDSDRIALERCSSFGRGVEGGEGLEE